MFDGFILVAIVVNAALMGMTDYSNIDTDPTSADYMQPVTQVRLGSIRFSQFLA